VTSRRIAHPDPGALWADGSSGTSCSPPGRRRTWPGGGAAGVGPGPGPGQMEAEIAAGRGRRRRGAGPRAWADGPGAPWADGVHSHGAQLLPALVRNIRRGITSPDPRIEVLVGAYCTTAVEAERFVYEVCTFSASSARIDREVWRRSGSSLEYAPVCPRARRSSPTRHRKSKRRSTVWTWSRRT
jgi:hypothetical protein